MPRVDGRSFHVIERRKCPVAMRRRRRAVEQLARIDQAVMRLGGRRLRIGDIVDGGVIAN